MRFIATPDKTELYVKDWGAGRPVILMSGWPLSSDSWDDQAAVIKQTGAKDAVLVGFSMGGGEVARYMSRHEGKGVSQAALLSSILPFRLKTPDNPGGTDQAAFDVTAKAINEDRPLVTLTQANLMGGVTPSDITHRTDYEKNWSTVLSGLSKLFP